MSEITPASREDVEWCKLAATRGHQIENVEVLSIVAWGEAAEREIERTRRCLADEVNARVAMTEEMLYERERAAQAEAALREMAGALAPFASCNPHDGPRNVDSQQWTKDVNRAHALLTARTALSTPSAAVALAERHEYTSGWASDYCFHGIENGSICTLPRNHLVHGDLVNA